MPPDIVSLDFNDIQGIIHHSYRTPLITHLLFEFGSKESGQRLLRFLVPKVTHAAQDTESRPDWLLNVGLTFDGLNVLGTSNIILESFPQDFQQGPVLAASTQGDLVESDPARWWNGKFETKRIHAAVHLYSQSEAIETSLSQEIRTAAADASCRELKPTQDDRAIECRKLPGPGEIHFGYRDGISQPDVRWGDGPAIPGTVDFRHFLLGYSVRTAPSSPDSADGLAFARNGCYSVFRWLHQDVAKFNRFLSDVGPSLFPTLPPNDAIELLAAKLVGRWRNGAPLILSPDRPRAELATANDFSYSADVDGRECPTAAHIRVVNPRDQELNFVEQIEPAGLPRVIRRGAPCGPKLEGTTDDGKERGLAGMFLCASIVRQVWKLLQWMNKTDFSPLFRDVRGQDPMANRSFPGATAKFAFPHGADLSAITLKDFITTKGTAFFLLPSLTTLRRLADDE